ncbi:MAG TPA: M48 family metalloprotease [Flavobacteriales bacterium]|nr:M48 family metalloprotease [Flavobacteriales bacterium]
MPTPPAWNTQLEARMHRWVEAIPDTLSREVRKDVTEQRVEQYEDLLDTGKDSLFICSGPLKDYLDHVLARVQAADPTVPTDIDLVLARYPWPNASCMGQGTLLFNIGMLERMENEPQVAFVIAHELAHQRMDHVGQHMIALTYKLHSRAFKQELNAVKRQSYGKAKRFRELLAGFYSPARRHGREHESQADSLALEWVTRAGYDPAQALTSMDVLDRCDDERTLDRLDLPRIFDRAAYPFKSEWLQYGGASSLGEFEEEHTALDDSLKTHPDCAQRKRDLEAMLAHLSAHIVPDIGGTDEAVRSSANECIETYYAADNYGRALFLALCGLQRDSTDLYLHGLVSRCLSALHQRSVKHELGKVLEYTGNENADNYNRVLAFLHNLHQKDYAELALHYLDPWREAAANNEDLLCADALAHRELGRAADAQVLAGRYTSLFPNGRFTRMLAPVPTK